jgi:small ligand-binding sensory domain FIST
VDPDPLRAAVEAADRARTLLGGARCDLAVLFAAGTHMVAPEATLQGVHETLAPAQLVGCGAGGTLAAGREAEHGTSVAVWAASLGDGTAELFRAEPDGDGIPDLTGAAGAILLADPYSFPTEMVLRTLSASAPAVPLLGGIASARTQEGGAALFLDDEIGEAGAVGVRFDGIEILPCVSQGAAPLGPELTITAGDDHIIAELAGKPALEKLRETVAGLLEEERAELERGLLLGIVVDPNKPDYVQGDFLVRGIVGVDPETGRIAVGADIRPGQVVRLHARNAQSAAQDLHGALAARRAALGAGGAAGALVFACNGRGEGMFGCSDHDAAAVEQELRGAPAAGFFAAGEIGPVGGEYFLHGFTATIAVFGA